MAESGYSTPSWGSMSTGPGAQGLEVVAPLLSAHAVPFSHPFPPPAFDHRYEAMSNTPMSQYPDLPNGSFGHQTHLHSPYPPDGGQHMFYSPPPRLHPYLAAQPRPPPAFRIAPNHPRRDMGGPPDTIDMHGRPEHPRAPQPYFPPMPQSYEAPTSPPIRPHSLADRQHFSMMMALSQPSRGLGPLRMPSSGNHDPPRPIQSPNRRVSHQEYHSINRAYDGEMRRSSMAVDAQGHRSERSISPRISNRRSYDRYSFDLPQSSTSSDAEEAAARAPPSSRARHRPREVRPRFFGQHHHLHLDPNIATSRQIQELKDKLPRRMLADLAKDASTACDICSKDYSSTHVQPTEEEEVAVELPCGHVFGEFCMFQWFDTCKTHKNKVTCPMCRKQLIEPSRYHPALLSAMSRGGQAFQELLANELRGSDFSNM